MFVVLNYGRNILCMKQCSCDNQPFVYMLEQAILVMNA